ncbi:hypothetical protein AGMMS49974_03070 [Deltaproteobacteria bacterium]|nr:hypothetical protein AGMMS49974_03070 [Deltaproteobacteria bacterium]
MAPYVFVRPGELRRAKWTEFDLEAAKWRIPPARMKMRELHIVPLARQVVDILKELQPFYLPEPLFIPSMRAKSATKGGHGRPSQSYKVNPLWRTK